MKVAAHPMLVAVALGLLGPNALAADAVEDERDRRGSASATRAAADDGIARKDVMSALDTEEGPYWTRLELVQDDGDDLKVD